MFNDFVTTIIDLIKKITGNVKKPKIITMHCIASILWDFMIYGDYDLEKRKPAIVLIEKEGILC